MLIGFTFWRTSKLLTLLIPLSSKINAEVLPLRLLFVCNEDVLVLQTGDGSRQRGAREPREGDKDPEPDARVGRAPGPSGGGGATPHHPGPRTRRPDVLQGRRRQECMSQLCHVAWGLTVKWHG